MVSVTARTEYVRGVHQVCSYGAAASLVAGLVALVMMPALGASGLVTAGVTAGLVVVSLAATALSRMLPRGAVLLSVDGDSVYFGTEEHGVTSRGLSQLVSATLGPVATRTEIGGRNLLIGGMRYLTMIFTTGIDADGDGHEDIERWSVVVADSDPAAARAVERLRVAAPGTPSRMADGGLTPAESASPVSPSDSEVISGPRIVDAGSEDAARRLWEETTRRHDDVLRAYGNYETDPAMMLAYPAVTDVTLDQVQNFQLALENADALRTERYPGSRDRAGAYQRAVESLRRAWVTCERDGRRIGTRYLRAADQDDMTTALRLYRHARGENTEDAQDAYTRVRTIVGDLIDRGSLHPPQAAVAELDATAGVTATAPPASHGQ
ncbi:hypothetical protein ABLE92_16875 [Gordonia sp. VNQ95]|uniref:hypothetical protein n=1 Tax=Gordonia TaxID=2053 RepID=UPI0032B60C5B